MKPVLLKRGPRADLIAVELSETEIAPLDPDQLGQMAEDAMRTLLAEGESDNTIRSYQTALRYWAAWFSLRYRQPIALPVPAPVVIQFIVDHAQRKTADGLACELPQAIDRAMVDGGFKAGLRPPALATLVHRQLVAGFGEAKRFEARFGARGARWVRLLRPMRLWNASRWAISSSSARANPRSRCGAVFDTDIGIGLVRDQALQKCRRLIIV